MATRGAGGRFIKGGGGAGGGSRGGGGSGGGRGKPSAFSKLVSKTIDKAINAADRRIGKGMVRGRGGPMVKRIGNWEKVTSTLTGVKGRLAKAIQLALMQEAHFLRMHMVQGFTSQAPGGVKFAPLSQFTLAMRSLSGFAGSKALIRTGSLRGSITVVKEAGGVVFVGVHRRASGSGKLVNIAEIHEFGRTIRITPKMQRFLHARMREAVKGLGVMAFSQFGSTHGRSGYVVIPPRPFVRPVYEAYVRQGDAARKRFYASLAKSMGWKNG